MIRMDDSLAELVRAGKVSEETALRASENRKELLRMLRPESIAAAPAAAPARSRFGGMFKKDDR